MAGDFLGDLLRLAVEASLESPVAVKRLELQLRRELGGTRHYIAKNPQADRSDRARLNAAPERGTSATRR